MRPNLFFLSQDIFTYFLSLEGALTGLFFYLKFYRRLFILLREGLLLSKERKLLNIIIYNTPHCEWGYLDCSAGEEPTCNAGDTGLIPGLERSPGGGHGNPLQYSCLENPHGQRSLAGHSPQDWKESDTAEQLSTAKHRRIRVREGVVMMNRGRERDLKILNRFVLFLSH